MMAQFSGFPEGVIHFGDERLTITTFPPLPTERGVAWWIRLDDIWIRLRPRSSREQLTPDVADDLCRIVGGQRPNA